MRLFLLPISSRRVLLYCQKAQVVASSGQKETIPERLQNRAAKTWASWEKKESGWQRKVVDYGNYALRRIPYEEWGLKSVPSLSEARKTEEPSTAEKVEVVYPQSLIHQNKIRDLLQVLSTEREALHRRRMIWSFVGMPISAPVALIPVVPNIPFFYLVFRAWSHWRALSGGKHIQFLLQNKLLNPVPSSILDSLYTKQNFPLPSAPEPTNSSDHAKSNNIDPSAGQQTEGQALEGETLLLSQDMGKTIARELDIPQLEVELERAIWQVETAVEKQNAEAREKASAQGPSERSSPESSTGHVQDAHDKTR